MPNSNDMVNELEFEKQIQGMSDRALIEFNARQSYEITEAVKKLCERETDVEKRFAIVETEHKNMKENCPIGVSNKKLYGISAGAGGLVGGIISGVMDFLLRPR